jgi:hypothetical protein
MYLYDVFISIGILVFYTSYLYAHTIGELLTPMLVCGITDLAEPSCWHVRVEYSLSLDRPFIFNLDAIQYISLP